MASMTLTTFYRRRMAMRFTQANLRTIAQYGEKECLACYAQNVVAGEGANTIGGGDKSAEVIHRRPGKQALD